MVSKNHKGVKAIAVAVVLVAIGVNYDSEPATPSTATTAAAATTRAPAPDPALAADPRIAVIEIIDGDTFVTADGTKVRPLGIDSCEMGTPGGQRAKDDAAIWLSGQNVVLRTEPGVDKDIYGRSLRYVEVYGTDFGKLMVSYDHTGVYQGKLAPQYSANPTYLAELRAEDSDGRNCAGTSAGTAPPVVINKDGDDDHHRGKGWVRRHVCGHHWWC